MYKNLACLLIIILILSCSISKTSKKGEIIKIDISNLLYTIDKDITKDLSNSEKNIFINLESKKSIPLLIKWNSFKVKNNIYIKDISIDLLEEYKNFNIRDIKIKEIYNKGTKDRIILAVNLELYWRLFNIKEQRSGYNLIEIKSDEISK